MNELNFSENQSRKEQSEKPKIISEIAEKLGYEFVNTIDELLDETEKKKLNFSKQMSRLSFVYLISERKDGKKAKAVIGEWKNGNNMNFTADIFSPAFYNGRGGNNDFSASELESDLKMALEFPEYK